MNINNLKVFESTFSEVRHIFEKYHYKGSHMGGGISMTLKVVYSGEKTTGVIVGGVVLGLPRHTTKYPDSLEIRRMALIDEAPRNSETIVLSQVLGWVKRNYPKVRQVISYSDLSVGHTGTIYRAANFVEVGKTSPSLHVFWNGARYHPRSLTIDRPYSYALREAVKRGEATVEKGDPKIIFIYYMLAKERELKRKEEYARRNHTS